MSALNLMDFMADMARVQVAAYRGNQPATTPAKPAPAPKLPLGGMTWIPRK